MVTICFPPSHSLDSSPRPTPRPPGRSRPHSRRSNPRGGKEVQWSRRGLPFCLFSRENDSCSGTRGGQDERQERKKPGWGSLLETRSARSPVWTLASPAVSGRVWHSAFLNCFPRWSWREAREETLLFVWVPEGGRAGGGVRPVSRSKPGTRRRGAAQPAARSAASAPAVATASGRPKGKGEGRGEEIQGTRADWSSRRGVRFCAPSDWWRERSR